MCARVHARACVRVHRVGRACSYHHHTCRQGRPRPTAERETAGQGTCVVCEFPKAAVTKYHKPGALVQQKWILSHFGGLLSSKSRCRQGPAPSETGWNLSLLLPCSRCCCQSWACTGLAPISASDFKWCFSLSVFMWPSQEDTSHGALAVPQAVVTPAGTLPPSKVFLTGVGAGLQCIFLEGTAHNSTGMKVI